jgi:CheY-like chemotaxis protein
MSLDQLRRVMLVEDDPDIQQIAQMALEMVGGLTVHVCSGGREALDQLPGCRPDIILLDVMMPGMDGPTTMQQLRTMPEAAGIPVVFMTAKVQSADRSAYLDLGAAGIIAKPFDPMHLPATVAELWSAWHRDQPRP